MLRRFGALLWELCGYQLTTFVGGLDGRRVCGLYLWVRRDGLSYGRTVICWRF